MARRELDFSAPIAPPWHVTQIGQGQVALTPGAARLALPPVSAGYSDAQISDYAGKAGFTWHPPVRLTVTARAEGDLRGTAGFGFWNHPFVPGERGVRPPKAAWFFHASPPNDMALALGVPGYGWKAATIDATRWQFLALLPTAPLGIPLMHIPALYRRLWPVGQRALGVSERALDPALLRASHTYTLDWRADGITFAVDGETVHHTPTAPRGPLGFIAWADNQYAVVTPGGRFAFGLLPTTHPQTLLIERVVIEGG
jgi:hypothetical protein